jgi:hypothetical protein
MFSFYAVGGLETHSRHTSVEGNILCTLPVIYTQNSKVTNQVHHRIWIINAIFLNEVGMNLRNFWPFDNQSDIFKWDEDT